MDVLEAIRGRRSIRHFKPDHVDDELVLKVLEAAHWAPSWGNTQCWRFIVVRDPETRSRIGDTLAKIRLENEWVENAGAIALKQAPVLVVFCAELGKAGYRSDGTATASKGDYWYIFDVALATQNFALAAYSYGLGTVIVAGFDADKVAEILEVPSSYTVVTMTPLGYPEHRGQVSPRKNLKQVTYFEKYGT
jgi:nitroreductase